MSHLRLSSLPAFLLLAVAACTLSGCFVSRQSTNEPLSMRAVSGLQPGTTTAQEVVQRLGAPNDVIQLGKRSAYRYDHTIQKSAGLWLLLIGFFNEDARQDRIWVFFDERNLLTHVGSTFSSHRPQYSMPWEDIHERSDNEPRDEDRREEEGVE